MATPATEARLITWARGVSPSAIRRKADAAEKPDLEAVKDAHATRLLRWKRPDGAPFVPGPSPPALALTDS